MLKTKQKNIIIFFFIPILQFSNTPTLPGCISMHSHRTLALLREQGFFR